MKNIFKYYLINKNDKLFQCIQKKIAMFNCVFSPIHLSIEITRQCNLRCYFCPSRFTEDEKEHLSFEQFKKILGKLKNIRVLTLLGRGETLMNPDVFKIIEYSINKGVKVIDIVTNGTLLSENNIKHLRNVTNFTISVDSCDPHEYYQMRGYELNKIEENLIRLTQIADWKPAITIQTLITKNNMFNMPKMITWAKKVFAIRCNFLLMIAFNKEIDETNPQFSSEFQAIIDETMKLAQENKMKVNFPSPFPSRRFCFEPWRSVRIDIHGNIYPCCYIFESDKNWTEWYYGRSVIVAQEQYVMGNIFTDEFAKIWNGIKYKKLRSIVRKGNTPHSLPVDKFSDERISAAKENKELFSYCDYCLYRWSCAC